MSHKEQSIVYVNFSPYENAGRILDWLVSEFEVVVLFSFNFHKLNNKGQSNYVQIFESGKSQSTIKLFELPTPESLLFITLPLIIILIACQTVWHLLRLKAEYGRFNTYLSVNAFTSWLGNVMRSVGLVEKTIFWVWDYYPPHYPDFFIRLARWGYWQFDRWATKGSSSVVFLNKRLLELRQEIGILSKKTEYPIVPIGTNPGKLVKTKEKIIGHLGVLKRSQGLDLLFDVLPELIKELPDLKIEIIGSGPDEAHFKARAKGFPAVKFLGFIKDEDKVDTVIQHWSAGIATYIPDESSPHSWTDPSKMKAYISQGVPVITTNVSPFSDEIRKANAGVIIDYNQPKEFVKAVVTLTKETNSYKSEAFDLAKKYQYQELYRQLVA